MKTTLTVVSVLYIVMGCLVFAMHTQMPVTFGLALLRSTLWPIWMAGGLQGSPTYSDEGE